MKVVMIVVMRMVVVVKVVMIEVMRMVINSDLQLDGWTESQAGPSENSIWYSKLIR